MIPLGTSGITHEIAKILESIVSTLTSLGGPSGPDLEQKKVKILFITIG